MIAMFGLAAAASVAQLRPICTDRPAKANAVCTVPAGHWQIEASFGDWTLTKAGGVRTTALTIAPTTVKYGLNGSSDLEVTVVPFARLRTSGQRSVTGTGDMVIRYKQRVMRDDAPVQVAAIPFVKVPTARHGLGNGKAEGGIAVPVSLALSGPVTMTLGPEADLLADGSGAGRHPGIVNLVNVAAPVVPKLTIAAEIWNNLNFDPAGTIRQASADVAASYAASSSLQFDAGANVGLTRATADLEVYAGVSLRF